MIPRLTFALKTVDLTEWSVLTLHNKKKQMPKWLKKEKKGLVTACKSDTRIYYNTD